MSQPENGTGSPLWALSVSEDDLVALGEESKNETSSPRFATFQVLSCSLSKLDILPGDVLKLQLLAESEIPTEISIVAVRVQRESERALLLRLFLPPRQFFQNTDRVFGPLLLDPRTKIVAAAAWGVGRPHWRAPLS
jgi:hypothetical protein